MSFWEGFVRAYEQADAKKTRAQELKDAREYEAKIRREDYAFRSKEAAAGRAFQLSQTERAEAFQLMTAKQQREWAKMDLKEKREYEAEVLKEQRGYNAEVKKEDREYESGLLDRQEKRQDRIRKEDRSNTVEDIELRFDNQAKLFGMQRDAAREDRLEQIRLQREEAVLNARIAAGSLDFGSPAGGSTSDRDGQIENGYSLGTPVGGTKTSSNNVDVKKNPDLMWAKKYLQGTPEGEELLIQLINNPEVAKMMREEESKKKGRGWEGYETTVDSLLQYDSFGGGSGGDKITPEELEALDMSDPVAYASAMSATASTKTVIEDTGVNTYVGWDQQTELFEKSLMQAAITRRQEIASSVKDKSTLVNNTEYTELAEAIKNYTKGGRYQTYLRSKFGPAVKATLQETYPSVSTNLALRDITPKTPEEMGNNTTVQSTTDSVDTSKMPVFKTEEDLREAIRNKEIPAGTKFVHPSGQVVTMGESKKSSGGGASANPVVEPNSEAEAQAVAALGLTPSKSRERLDEEALFEQLQSGDEGRVSKIWTRTDIERQTKGLPKEEVEMFIKALVKAGDTVPKDMTP